MLRFMNQQRLTLDFFTEHTRPFLSFMSISDEAFQQKIPFLELVSWYAPKLRNNFIEWLQCHKSLTRHSVLLAKVFVSQFDVVEVMISSPCLFTVFVVVDVSWDCSLVCFSISESENQNHVYMQAFETKDICLLFRPIIYVQEAIESLFPRQLDKLDYISKYDFEITTKNY